MPNHPLSEVFGYPTDNFSPEANHCRQDRLCPFKEKRKDGSLQKCNKVSKDDPLGVCSIFNAADERVITCPVRFQQEWLIARDAAGFFFPSGVDAEHVTEVRLTDQDEKSVGSVDIVLLSPDAQGCATDYGSLEVQAVYISGNIRQAFAHYMEDPVGRHDMDWRGQTKYPRPDFLSSSRKRLAPQLLSKGGILSHWGRKMAVALDARFYSKLPTLEIVDQAEADIAWFIYDLIPASDQNRNVLTLQQTVYTKFEAALLAITHFEAGDESKFIDRINTKAKDARKAKDENAPVEEDLDPNV